MCPNFPWALDKLPGCCAQLPQASLEGKCSGPMGSQFRPLLEGILHQTGQILTQYVNLVGLKHVFGLKGLFSGESEMKVHPCTGLAASQEGGKGHGSSGPSSRAATDLCTRLTLHTPGPCSPETILTTGASSWSSRGMELVFMGSNKPITPLLS